MTSLAGGTQYYFAIKVVDDSENVSELSNTAPASSSIFGERVLQTGVNGYVGVKDSYIFGGSPSSNYGSLDRMIVSGFADMGSFAIQRGLLKFDLSSISADTVLTSAVVSLYSTDAASVKGNTGFYGLYPLTRDWTDTQVTWNVARTGTSWTAAGGDFAAAADATSPKQAVAGVWYSFDVTARVQGWLAAPSANLGWVVRCTNELLHNQDRFYASETANAACRPKLVISDLEPPVPGDINGDGSVDVVDLLYLVDRLRGHLRHRPQLRPSL